MKICSKCHIEKPFDAFAKSKNKCRQCIAEYDRQYYLADKSKKKNIAKKWRDNNKERNNNNVTKLFNSIPSGIYKITCLVNGKFYIGQSVKPYKRILAEHLSVHKKQNRLTSISLQEDLKQYGRENFVYEILEHCEPELLTEREIHYIKTLKPEYNEQQYKRSQY